MDGRRWSELAVRVILVQFREGGFPGIASSFVEATGLPQEKSGFDVEVKKLPGLHPCCRRHTYL